MDAFRAMGSVERVRAALRAAGHPDTIVDAPAGARTAAEAAAAVGCDVAQIVKSLIFKITDRPLLVIASGANRVDPDKVTRLVGAPIGRADGVREITGFALGGVAPVGHLTPPTVLLDQDLLALDPLWAAAGSPNHVFRTSAVALQAICAATVADVAA
jgi:prolyl-tRNA editing enzyme YbaK/EbsC (Cys-tRNA(Pro) deacylase)